MHTLNTNVNLHLVVENTLIMNYDESQSQFYEEMEQIRLRHHSFKEDDAFVFWFVDYWIGNEVDGLKSEISNGTEFGKKNLKEITEHAEFQINHTVTLTKKSLDDFMKQNKNQINLSQKQFEDYFLELTLKLENFLEHSHKAEHKLGQMDALKPLFDLVNGKFDSVTSISEIIVILDKLYVNIKSTDLDKHYVSSDVKRLREKLLDLISHE